MIKKTVLYCVLTIAVKVTYAARILGVIPTPSYSHQLAHQSLWRELSLRGHQVTTITTDPINDPTLVNLTEIDMHSLYKSDVSPLQKIIDSTLFETMFAILDTFEELSHNFLSHQSVQNLIKNESETFDVVMVELSMLPMLGFAKRFNAPLVVITSVDAPSDIRSFVGSPTHPIAYPDWYTEKEDNFSLFDRMLAVTFVVFLEMMRVVYIIPTQQLLLHKYFGPDYPPVQELESGISLVLTHSDLVFHRIKPLLPIIIQIGGGSHRSVQKPLPKELQETLDAAKNGFIYFSLGSNVQSRALSETTRNIMLETFSELPYTILWKYEADLSDKPINVITAKWFPQQAVLSHPNIKLFITQGGLQSMDEAIYEHVPMIGIPFYGDQPFNVNKMASKGFGLYLNHKTLSKTEFKTAILEVFNNPKYKDRVKELAKLALDQPMTGLEKAVWWTEYVIRHNGTKYLRSPVLDIPFYQYYMLDVVAVAILALTISITIFVIALKLLLRFLRLFTSITKIKQN